MADHHFLSSGSRPRVDVGNRGADEFEHFRRTVIDGSITRLLALVNISRPGMGDAEQVVANLDAEAAAQAALEHRDVVAGIKTAHYWTKLPFDAEHPPWASVERAVEAGRLCDMPVIVDFWPRPPERPYPDLILKKLRPGDIHTHVFARQFPVIDAEGRVYPYMREARARGSGSTWATAPPASGSATPKGRSMTGSRRTASAPTSMMAASERPSTACWTPCPGRSGHGNAASRGDRALHRRPGAGDPATELGTLSPGAEADVAVLELQQGEFSFRDCGHARIDGDRRRADAAGGEDRLRARWSRAAALARRPGAVRRLPELQTGPIERHWRP